MSLEDGGEVFDEREGERFVVWASGAARVGLVAPIAEVIAVPSPKDGAFEIGSRGCSSGCGHSLVSGMVR